MRAVTGKWFLAGSVVTIAVFAIALGARPDLLDALSSWRFLVKLALVLAASTVAAVNFVRLTSPLETRMFTRLDLLVPSMLLAAIGAELIVSPAASWSQQLIGTNAAVCLIAIPALAFPLFAAGMQVMRAGAPGSTASAGAAVGNLAAALAAVLYALHCFDDSPLFVAVWYGLAQLAVIALGAAVGRRLLRW
jgi:hypothetical protein